MLAPAITTVLTAQQQQHPPTKSHTHIPKLGIVGSLSSEGRIGLGKATETRSLSLTRALRQSDSQTALVRYWVRLPVTHRIHCHFKQ
jgi:hypothetical protein